MSRRAWITRVFRLSTRRDRVGVLGEGGVEATAVAQNHPDPIAFFNQPFRDHQVLPGEHEIPVRILHVDQKVEQTATNRHRGPSIRVSSDPDLRGVDVLTETTKQRLSDAERDCAVPAVGTGD